MSATEIVRESDFTPEQMFALVADVPSYPEFVPYCVGARVQETRMLDNGHQIMLADFRVAYKMIRETYTSEVDLDPQNLTIMVAQQDGPFRRLENRWQFEPREGGCFIKFYLDFDFRAPLLRRVIQPLMGRAVDKFVAALKRARISYMAKGFLFG